VASRTAAALLVVLAACAHGGPKQTPSPEQPALAADTSCRAVVEHEIDVLAKQPDLDAATLDGLTTHRAETAAMLIEECEAAEPSIEFRQCLLDAQEFEGFGKCADEHLGPATSAELSGPTAADLATFTADLEGAGPLLATIETSMGTIHCELAEHDAPMTVANFVGLARGKIPWLDPDTGNVVTDTPFYDGLTFHRVIPTFMIQGGDPAGNGTGGPGYEFGDELALSFDRPGILAMANSGPGTNGSQFFITDGDASHLTGKHTVFGYCQDLDVVGDIARVHTGRDDRPDPAVTIKTIAISRGK
jgi:cyclophilin family peptidyl-prolyl cis-trans isomerase